jgi:hypothetical protein
MLFLLTSVRLYLSSLSALSPAGGCSVKRENGPSRTLAAFYAPYKKFLAFFQKNA